MTTTGANLRSRGARPPEQCAVLSYWICGLGPSLLGQTKWIRPGARERCDRRSREQICAKRPVESRGILLEAHASLESGPRPRPSTHIHMPPRLSLLNTRQRRVAFTSLQILRALTRFRV